MRSTGTTTRRPRSSTSVSRPVFDDPDIAADTGADRERALLLAAGLTGLSETSARWWLPRKGTVSREEAVALMSSLAWRGISGFPRVDVAEPPEH